jgi:UDPglucose 6-dehydrogenase
VKALLQEGCNIVAHDPAAAERALPVLPIGPQMQYAADSYAAADGADALLILTDWPEFARLDLGRLQRLLRYPIVIDGRNLYSPNDMFENGLMYLSIGRPASYPTRDIAAVQNS